MELIAHISRINSTPPFANIKDLIANDPEVIGLPDEIGFKSIQKIGLPQGLP
jgi:hypothetical protein